MGLEFNPDVYNKSVREIFQRNKTRMEKWFRELEPEKHCLVYCGDSCNCGINEWENDQTLNEEKEISIQHPEKP